MHHIEGGNRDQAQLSPARIDDYVDRDNPVRFIDAFVDDLDLNGAELCPGRGLGQKGKEI